MKVSKNFYLQEFVPKEIYTRFGDKSTMFLSEKLVPLAEAIRSFFGDKPMTLNNWHFGGKRNYSGYRPPNCKEGAELSRHKLGVAIDFFLKGLDSDIVISEIIRNYYLFKAFGLTTLETGTDGWVHASVEWTNKESLVLIPFK